MKNIFSYHTILYLLLCTATSGCGFNAVIEADENQYKRRADLVPNLVATVKGSANFEQETLTKVVQARAMVGKVQIDSSTIDNPDKLAALEKAQGRLSHALSRLLVVSERYPELKSTQAYQTLAAQLEGTENRIAVARKRYIEAVAIYNRVVLSFPSMIGAQLRGKQVRPTFSGDPSAEQAPQVAF
jgi:LemA protein